MSQAGRRRAVKVTATVGHRYAGAGQVLRVTARSLTRRATGCSAGPGHCGVYCHGLKLLLEFNSPVQLRWLTSISVTTFRVKFRVTARQCQWQDPTGRTEPDSEARAHRDWYSDSGRRARPWRGPLNCGKNIFNCL